MEEFAQFGKALVERFQIFYTKWSMFLVQNESKVGQIWTTNIYCTLFETEEASESGVSEMLEREEKRGRARDWS